MMSRPGAGNVNPPLLPAPGLPFGGIEAVQND